MYRSTIKSLSGKDVYQSVMTPLALRVALLATLGATAGANADYQQTLAARGADAYSQPPITIEIDNATLADTFSNNIVEANPALSDQEVMVDLNARMHAEQRLEQAAANLDPTAVAEVVTQTGTPSDDSSAATEDNAAGVAQTSNIDSAPAAVASR